VNRSLAVASVIALVISLIAVGIFVKKNQGVIVKVPRNEADTLYNTAVALQAKGELNEAVRAYQDLIRQFPRNEKSADALYKLAELCESRDLLEKARMTYEKIIANFPSFKQIADVEKKLWDLNTKILFSQTVTDRDIIYKVEPGDTLSKIAAKYNTTVDLLMQSNGLKDHLIRSGQRLKVCTTKYSVIVDKSQNILTLKADDKVFKIYTVATGENNCTPVGTFKIVEKLKDPAWYRRGKGVVSSESPENVLGTRWMGLSEDDYGIHGGAVQQDLGCQVTKGCVRMTNPEVEELFTILPRQTDVTIVD